MKRNVLLITLLVLAMAIGGISTVFAKTTKLTYSCFFPPTHIQSRLADAWCQEVEKRTNGRVKIDYFPGQTLTKARQVYDGTVQGLSDIGFSVFAYTRGRFPVMAAVDLPLGYASGVAATEVINRVYDKFKPKELGEVCHYFTGAFSAAYTTSFFVVMNKDRWNSLPADARKTIQEINKEWAVKHGQAWDSSDMAGIKFFMNQKGQAIGLDAKEQARWKKAVSPIIDDYVAKANEKGLNGMQIVDFIKQNLDELQ